MKNRRLFSAWALGSMILGWAGSALAVDGVVLIDQNRAIAGNVTPGDTPGFPVTISKAGSYRLSGNLTVPDENTDAIEIPVDNVSLDLNGFAILGPTVCSGVPLSCSPSGNGRGVNAAGKYYTVINGTIRGMGRFGIVTASGSSSGRVENMHVSSCNSTGILVSGGGIVSNNTANSNGGNGISVSNGTVNNNTASSNGESGISVVGSSTVSNNTSISNGGDGISVTIGTVSNNTVVNNKNRGIVVSEGTVINNSARANTNLGLALSNNAGYVNNSLSANNGGGTQVGGGVQLGDNLCNGILCP